MQMVLCTSSQLAWTCKHCFARAKNPLHGQALEKFNLLIYWFQNPGITYPTLEMIKIYPKSRLFNDKSDVFWMGFGFKIWRCDISSLEPVPAIMFLEGLTVQMVLCTSSQLAWTCRDASARLLPNADRAQGSLHVQGARLAAQRVLCTSSQLAWTCK